MISVCVLSLFSLCEFASAVIFATDTDYKIITRKSVLR